MRKKRSLIWKISKEELENIIKTNDSFGKVLKYFNLNNKGGNVKTLKARLKYECIDFNHIKLGIRSNKNRKFNVKLIPLENVLVENSDYSRYSLKKRLISNNLLENKCQLCNQLPEWQNENLVMVLDHINGVSNDNRLENLRLLCPNCNSQTLTFSGRNKRNG